jgi:hypothetical protein
MIVFVSTTLYIDVFLHFNFLVDIIVVLRNYVIKYEYINI